MDLDTVKSYTGKERDIFTYEKPALLVIDMQKGFCYPGTPFSNTATLELVPPIQSLLRYFRQNGAPVIYTEFVYSKDCPCLNGRFWTCEKDIPDGGVRTCHVGDPSADTIDELKPQPGELVIRKRGYDAFAGTELDYCLRAQGIRSLIMVGILTDECLFASVSGAFHHEYEVTVASDCTMAMTEPMKDMILRAIDIGYGNVYKAEEIVRILDART